MGNAMDPRLFDKSSLQDKNYYLLLVDLIEYISSKHYKIGDRLPQEEALAANLNTNRSTLREILRVLEVMGIIDSRRGSGNVYLGNIEIGFMNLILVSSMMENGKPLEFCSVRASIEASAIDVFIDKAVDADIYKLEILYSDHMSGDIDKSSFEYLDAHLRFHEQLMKYYDSEIAKQLVRSGLRLMRRDYDKELVQDSSISTETKLRLKAKLEGNSHLMIINAIKARDKSKARELVINHAFMSGMHKKLPVKIKTCAD